MKKPASTTTRNIIHLAPPMLVAQVAVMLNGTVDTVMAGQISPLDLATVGIGASIYAAVFISSMGVLTHPGSLLALSELTPEMDVRVRAYLAVLARYIRDANIFVDNAAGAVL